ncbi:hypothetical protein CYMTET_8760 [Cymbomonas tetramitiformis]|uniref:EGF-like domain-containing protein n=1 Tax=Cymbomonas tetramitiformis TaxID=36881 RepID=A0AAE0GSS6_9CHLO|nr:hypothetical protein CYMTET_8760 [Cymbomonas tetramitiformis]
MATAANTTSEQVLISGIAEGSTVVTSEVQFNTGSGDNDVAEAIMTFQATLSSDVGRIFTYTSFTPFGTVDLLNSLVSSNASGPHWPPPTPSSFPDVTPFGNAGLQNSSVSSNTSGPREAACYGSCVNELPPGSGYVCEPCPADMVGDGSTCMPNMCFRQNGGCDVLVACTVSLENPQERQCGECPAGYGPVPDAALSAGWRCGEVDGCVEAPCWSTGDFQQQCTDVPAPGSGRMCGACPAGFSAALHGAGCADVDECQPGGDAGCWVSDEDATIRTTCLNQIGGHACSACPVDYIGTGESGCRQRAPCSLHNGNCDPLSNCSVNALTGSAQCGACPVGYSGTGDTKCVDTDGCALEPCFPGVECADVAAPGEGRTCGSCPEGYRGSGVSCELCTLALSLDPMMTTSTNGTMKRSIANQVAGVFGGLSGQDCVLTQGVKYMWHGVTSRGSAVALDSTTNKRETLILYLPKGSLSAATVYSMRLTATLSGNTDVVAEVDTSFEVKIQPLVALIQGGLVYTGEGIPVVLDAGVSYDPDGASGEMTYAWSCARVNSTSSESTCRDASGMPLGTPVSAVLSLTLEGGSAPGVAYVLSCQVAKGARRAQAHTTVTIVAGTLPVPAILPLQHKHTANTKLVLSGQVATELPDALALSWSAELLDTGEGTSTAVDLLAVSATTLDLFDLVLRPDALVAGRLYLFTLVAVDTSGRAWAGLKVRVNAPPEGGTLLPLAPLEGTAGETEFRFESRGWVDDPEDLPLLYELRFEVAGGVRSDSVRTRLAESVRQRVTLAMWQPSPIFTAALPVAGEEAHSNLVLIYMYVKDALEAMTHVVGNATVQPMAFASAEAQTEHVDNALGDAAQAILNGGDASGAILAMASILAPSIDPADALASSSADATAGSSADASTADPADTPTSNPPDSRSNGPTDPPAARPIEPPTDPTDALQQTQPTPPAISPADPPATSPAEQPVSNPADPPDQPDRTLLQSAVDLPATNPADALKPICPVDPPVANPAAAPTTSPADRVGAEQRSDANETLSEEAHLIERQRQREQMMERQRQREQMMEITAAICEQQPATTGSVTRAAELLVAVSGGVPSELSPATRASARELASNMAALISSGSAEVALTGDAAAGFMDSLSSVAVGAVGGANQSTEISETLEVVGQIAFAHAQELVPGEEPVTSGSEVLSYVVQYDDLDSSSARAFSDAVIAPNAAALTLPPSIGAALGGADRKAFVTILTSTLDSHAAVDSGGAVLTDVTTISLKTHANGTELPVHGLSTALNFTLPIVATSSAAGTTAGGASAAAGGASGALPHCVFWDEGAGEYSTEGCTTLPNPAPWTGAAYWRTVNVSALASMEEAWGLRGSPGLTDGCEEEWGPVYSEFLGTDAGRRKYIGDECQLADPESSLGCWWEWRRGAFEGPRCVWATEVDCLCTHLTDFSAQIREGPYLDPPSRVTTYSADDLARLTVEDVAQSTTLLLVLGTMILSALLLHQASSWTHNQQRRRILLSIMNNEGISFRPVGKLWTWSIVDDTVAYAGGQSRKHLGKKHASLGAAVMSMLRKSKLRGAGRRWHNSKLAASMKRPLVSMWGAAKRATARSATIGAAVSDYVKRARSGSQSRYAQDKVDDISVESGAADPGGATGAAEKVGEQQAISLDFSKGRAALEPPRRWSCRKKAGHVGSGDYSASLTDGPYESGDDDSAEDGMDGARGPQQILISRKHYMALLRSASRQVETAENAPIGSPALGSPAPAPEVWERRRVPARCGLRLPTTVGDTAPDTSPTAAPRNSQSAETAARPQPVTESAEALSRPLLGAPRTSLGSEDANAHGTKSTLPEPAPAHQRTSAGGQALFAALGINLSRLQLCVPLDYLESMALMELAGDGRRERVAIAQTELLHRKNSRKQKDEEDEEDEEEGDMPVGINPWRLTRRNKESTSGRSVRERDSSSLADDSHCEKDTTQSGVRSMSEVVSNPMEELTEKEPHPGDLPPGDLEGGAIEGGPQAGAVMEGVQGSLENQHIRPSLRNALNSARNNARTVIGNQHTRSLRNVVSSALNSARTVVDVAIASDNTIDSRSRWGMVRLRQELSVERMLGTALVQAFLDIRSLISREDLQMQMDLAIGMPWQMPNNRPFTWWVSTFKVLIGTISHPGWYLRSHLWNLIFLQRVDGSFELSETLATVLKAGHPNQDLSDNPIPIYRRDSLVGGIPKTLLSAMVDARRRDLEEVWATILVLEQLQKYPYRWVENPDDRPSEQISLRERSELFLLHRSHEYPALEVAMPRIRVFARSLTECWTEDYQQCVKEMHQQHMMTVKLQRAETIRIAPLRGWSMLTKQMARRAWGSCMKKGKWIMRAHPLASIYMVQPLEPFSRSQRILIQFNTFILMLTFVVWFYYSKAVTCCQDKRVFLQCAASGDVTEPCLGFPTCAMLRRAEALMPGELLPESFSCAAFPKDDMKDRVTVILIMVGVLSPVTVALQQLFVMSSAESIPKHWQLHVTAVAEKRFGPKFMATMQMLAVALYSVLFDLKKMNKTMASVLVAIMGTFMPISEIRRFFRAISTVFRWMANLAGRGFWRLWVLLFGTALLARQGTRKGERRIQVRLSSPMENTLQKVAYSLIVGMWAVISWSLFTYVMLIREMLGPEAERSVVQTWALTLLMETCGKDACILICVRLLVLTITERVEELFCGLDKSKVWYEQHIMKFMSKAQKASNEKAADDEEAEDADDIEYADEDNGDVDVMIE